MKDLAFMATEEGVMAIPMRINGEADGRLALAQRVVTMLVSSTNDPARTYTTGILQDIGASNVRPAADLSNVFTLAITTVKQVIQQSQAGRADLEDDEILEDVTIENITTDVDSVSAEIHIVTRSGAVLKVDLNI